MDVAVEIGHGAIYMVESGDFDVDSYLKAVVEIFQSPDYIDGMPVIVDARLLTTPASSQQMQDLRRALDTPKFRRFRPCRYAMVTRTGMGHLQAKLAATLIGTRVVDPPESFVMRRFPTVEDAEAWIRESAE
jgi:hypothetical protein